MTPAPSLQGLAARVADGDPIDWTAAEALCSSDEDRAHLANLRLLADLGGVFRTDSDKPTAGDGGRDADAPIARAWGELEIVRKLGEGAFGEVFLARDHMLDREVALKLLRKELSQEPGLAERITREAQILASLRHRNVVTVHGADVREDRAGFWMEYIRGITLEQLVQEHGTLGAGELAVTALDVCHALAAVHAAGVIHRDVKAKNVMRDETGRVVLMDFGAGLSAKHVDAGWGQVGTPLYLAPEVLAGAPASVASDVYATGVLLFHLLTGRYPCDGASLAELVEKHQAGRRQNLTDLRPDLPPSLAGIVERAISPAPKDRFRSAGAMATALVAFLATPRTATPIPAVQPPQLTERTPSKSRIVSVSSLLGAALSVLLISAAIPLWRAEPESPVVRVSQFTLATGTTDTAIALGLTNDVIRELQRRGVVVREGVTTAGLTGLPLRELGWGAHVDHVLTGTIAQTESDHIKVSLQLVRKADRSQIWSGHFPSLRSGIPQLGSVIADKVAAALAGAPSGPTCGPAVRALTTRSLEAWRHNALGRQYAAERTEASLYRAIETYKQAIALDGAFPQPWVGLADAYVALGVPTFGPLSPREARANAKAAVLRAIDLDSDLPEAHATLGFLAYFHDWNWDAADAEFKRAITVCPQYAPAHHWYADYLNAMKRFREALDQIGFALQLDPTSVLFERDLAWHYFFQQRFFDAAGQLRDTLRHDATFGPAHSLLGRTLAETGNYDEALVEIARARLPRPTMLAFTAYVEATRGDRRAALKHLDDAVGAPSAQYLAPYYVALVHAALGDRDQVVAWLQRAYAEQDSTLVNVNADPRFQRFRTDPEFQALVAKMRFPPSPAP